MVSRNVRLASIGALILAVLPAAKASAVTLKVAYLRDINVIAMFQAEQAGYFKKFGIEVEKRPLNDGAAVASAVVSGAADIGYAASAIPISASDAGQPLRIFISNGYEEYPYSPNMTFLIASKRSGVKTLADLKGKTAVVNAVSGGCTLSLRDQLRHAGVSISSVKTLVVPFPQTSAVLRLGEAQAACIIEPFYTAIRLDPNIKPVVLAQGMLAGRKKGDRVAINGYFATVDWLHKNNKIAGEFLAAVRRASYDLSKNPTLFHQDLVKYFGMKPQFANKVPMTITPSGMIAKPAQYEPLLSAMAKSGMLKSPLTGTDIVETITPPNGG